MLKAMKKLFAAIALIALLAIGGGWYVLTQTDLLASPLTSTAVGSMLDNAVRANESAIAEKLGVSVEQVDAVVDELDIDSWQTVDTPSDLTADDSFSFDYQGTSVNATLYDDPEYITVGAGGQEVTLHVSDSAAQYLQYLQALQ